MSRRIHFRSAVAGGIVAALVVTALPAIAAQVGDAFELGKVNSVQARSTLTGSVPGQNLKIFNKHPDGEALFLSVEAGNAPLVVDSNKRVPKLNADLLDNRHASQLIRAAYGSSDNVVDADGDAVTATITAPKPGILVMSGSIDMNGTAFDIVRCQLEVDDVKVPGSKRSAILHSAGSVHTSNAQENCYSDGAKAVTAGTYTVALDMNVESAVLAEASVWVIWVPFDGSGQIPTS